MSNRFARPMLVVGMLAVFGGAVSAGPILLPGSATVGGVSQARQSSLWWSWALSYPSGANPVQDRTGALSGLGDRGSVFYLAGVFTNPTTGVGEVTRTATVAAGQTLFFPLVNVYSDFPLFGSTLDELRRDAADGLGVFDNGYIRLNGVDLGFPADGAGFRQLSEGDPDSTIPPGIPLGTFRSDLPDGNVFGEPGPLSLWAVSDGYWAAIAGLRPGTYTLEFGGRSRGVGLYDGWVNDQRIIYRLTVTEVPEPASVVVIGGVLAAGAWAVRRRRAGG